MRPSGFCLPAALASLLVLTASDAPAGCTTGGVWAMPPPGGTLAANGFLILEGTGNMTAAVAALDDEGLVLATDAEEIPLRVSAVHRGSWRITQVVLSPARPLEPGKRHLLRAAGTLRGSTLDAEVRRGDRLVWTAAPSSPPDQLRWTARPSHGPQTISHWCPGQASVPIRVPFDHPERLLGVLAEVRALRAGAVTQRFVVAAYRGEIALGHLGCDEPIGLAPKVPHLVKLTALDLAGRKIPAPGDAFAVVGPSEEPEPGVAR